MLMSTVFAAAGPGLLNFGSAGAGDPSQSSNTIDAGHFALDEKPDEVAALISALMSKLSKSDPATNANERRVTVPMRESQSA
jgi:hypothetical protein